MMRTLRHTKDSARLVDFLSQYPGTWRTYTNDARTRKAVARAVELGLIEVKADLCQMRIIGRKPSTALKMHIPIRETFGSLYVPLTDDDMDIVRRTLGTRYIAMGELDAASQLMEKDGYTLALATDDEMRAYYATNVGFTERQTP